MHEIQATREESQPIRTRTGGTTFANPPRPQGLAADRRGRLPRPALGGAQVSEKHCNFLINTGDATAADIEALGEEVRRRVRRQSGVDAGMGNQAHRRRRAGGGARDMKHARRRS